MGDDRYWLYAAVDPDSNELLHTKLEPTRTNVLAHASVAERREKHDVDNAVFLIDGALPLKDVCQRYGLDFRYERHGNRSSVERIVQKVKIRKSLFSGTFSNAKFPTAQTWLQTVAVRWNQCKS